MTILDVCERMDYLQAGIVGVLAFFVVFALTGGSARRPALSWPLSALAGVLATLAVLAGTCIDFY